MIPSAHGFDRAFVGLACVYRNTTRKAIKTKPFKTKPNLNWDVCFMLCRRGMMLSAAGERNEYLHRPCIDARRHCSTTVKLQALHCPWLVEGGQFEREPAITRTHTHLMYTEVWIVLSLSSGVAIILAPFGWRGEDWGATLTMPNFVCNTDQSVHSSLCVRCSARSMIVMQCTIFMLLPLAGLVGAGERNRKIFAIRKR